MSENKKYKLYAQNITAQNVAKAESQRFCRITSEYILIYTYGRKPYGSVEITTGETKRLTANDRLWLQDCNAALIMEQTKEKQGEIAADLSKKMKTLEIELMKEKERLESK